jgi:iron complex transport system permease protein
LATLLAGLAAARVWLGVRGAPVGVLADLQSLALARVGSGVLVGVALSVGGVFLQSLLRNPLASPDLMGLASGAGLGIMSSAYIGMLSGAGIAWTGTGGVMTTSAAIFGASGALALVYVFSQRRGLLDPVTLVLVGVIVGILCSAVGMLLQHLMPDQGTAARRLLIGALRDDVTGRELAMIGALIGASAAVGVAMGPTMDAASFGEDEARSVGVSVGRTRAVLFVLSGVLAACAVVLAGPVGFVGLICPHVARLLSGPRHRGLIVVAGLVGAILVVSADLGSSAVPLASGRLPINVITTLIGGPVLIGLLRREIRGR